jgi:hypothetical protein
MFAIVAAVALAVDIGMLTTARTESQRAADASALAGASALLVDPDDSAGAVLRAIDYAARNDIRGAAATVTPDDVFVILDSAKVRVFVLNTDAPARDNAIETFFARIFGVQTVNVATMATAWAAPAEGVTPTGSIEDCLLPIGLLGYYDTDGSGDFTAGDYELPFGTEDHHGTLLKLSYSGSTPSGPPQCEGEPAEIFNANPDVDYCNGPDDSWSCWWKDEEHEGGGSTDLGQQLIGNNCASITDETVYQASAGGEKQSLIQSDYEAGGPGSFRDIIEMDIAANGADLVWCPGAGEYGCAKRGSCASEECVTEGARMRVAPIISPDNVSGTGANNTFTVLGYTGVFIERVACRYDLGQWGGPEGQWEVYVRLYQAGVDGPGDVGNDPPDEDSLIRYLQLIE